MTKEELQKLQAEVYSRLEAQGYPVQQWAEQLKDHDPQPQPFKQITPSRYGKIKALKPGFTETIPHPRNPQRQVNRCQAAKKRTSGLIQCSRIAVTGKAVCQVHGGGKGSGVQTQAGRANQIASVTDHGRETRAIRAERQRMNAFGRLLTQKAVQVGLRPPTRTKKKKEVNYD